MNSDTVTKNSNNHFYFDTTNKDHSFINFTQSGMANQLQLTAARVPIKKPATKFMELPGEIREIIYAHVFRSSRVRARVSFDPKQILRSRNPHLVWLNSDPTRNILYTSKATFKEALPAYYKNTVVQFRGDGELFPRAIRQCPGMAKNLEYLRLSIEFFWSMIWSNNMYHFEQLKEIEIRNPSLGCIMLTGMAISKEDTISTIKGQIERYFTAKVLISHYMLTPNAFNKASVKIFFGRNAWISGYIQEMYFSYDIRTRQVQQLNHKN